MAYVVLNAGDNGDLNRMEFNWGMDSDTVIVRDGRFSIYTYEGADMIQFATTSDSYLPSTLFAGSGNDWVMGSAFRETVYDGSGADTVLFGAGRDVVHVGSGNDYFDGGEGADLVSFRWQSFDGFGSKLSNRAGVTFDLSLTSAQYLGSMGTDVFLNFEDILGGLGADIFRGTANVNAIDGEGGNDFIDGRGGNDVLNGDGGTDVVIGGAGADVLSPVRPGFIDDVRDYIRYFAATDSPNTAGAFDRIVAFQRSADMTGDRIDLSPMDGNSTTAGDQAFTWRGNVASFGTSALGEVRWQATTGGVNVFVDTDADAGAEMLIYVSNVSALGAVDFIL